MGGETTKQDWAFAGRRWRNDKIITVWQRCEDGEQFSISGPSNSQIGAIWEFETNGKSIVNRMLTDRTVAPDLIGDWQALDCAAYLAQQTLKRSREEVRESGIDRHIDALARSVGAVSPSQRRAYLIWLALEIEKRA